MLLEAEERHLCEEIAAGQAPYSQRASGLLALDTGATQAAAAQESGLTIGQVKYWLRKFREIRMDMFPDELLPQSEPELPPSGQLPLESIVPEVVELDQPAKQDAAAEKAAPAEKANDAQAEAEREKKGKVKAKKKSKKTKTTKKAKKKKKSKGGKKRKQTKDKKGKKKKGKKKSSGKRPGKKKKKGKK